MSAASHWNAEAEAMVALLERSIALARIRRGGWSRRKRLLHAKARRAVVRARRFFDAAARYERRDYRACADGMIQQGLAALVAADAARSAARGLR